MSIVGAGTVKGTTDLLETIRTGVDLAQLAAHVRNMRRASPLIDEAFAEINFVIDRPESLPSPIELHLLE